MAPVMPVAVPVPITPAAGQMAWWYNPQTFVLAHTTSNPGPPWLAFNSAADATAYGKAHGGKGFSIGALGNVITGGLSGAVGATGTALTDLSGFVSALSQKATWVRIGEGVLGLVMIAIGLTMISKGTAVGNAAGTAVKTATKVIK